MPKVSSENKKIAKNTMYMYIRFFVTLVVGLYTSRLVLAILGVSDYGLYSVIGGLLAMFTFISSSLGQATARFLNYEMGKKDGNINRVFCINLTTHIVMSLLILVLGEIGGLYYIYQFFNIESGRIPDAIFVFQSAIIVSCIGIANIPYYSLFVAKEKFGFLSAVDIANTLIRLGLIVLLQYSNGNVLRLYSLIMVVTTANTFIIYYVVARKRWIEIIKYKFVRGWNSYKEVLSFGWWNLLSTMAQTARSSGSDILINFFCGTAINGAYAIGRTVSRYALMATSYLDTATIPQITQSFSAGDEQRCNYLVNKMGRIVLLLFALIFFPVWIELDFVLHVWLKDVPEGVLLLSKLNLILSYVSITSGGIATFINATGRIKWFKIVISFFFLLCIPLGYILLKEGYPYYILLVLFIVADAVHRVVQFYMVKRLLNYDVKGYIKEAYYRPGIVIVVMVILLYLYDQMMVSITVCDKITAIVCCLLTTAVLVFFVGLTKKERAKLVESVKNRFPKK